MSGAEQPERKVDRADAALLRLYERTRSSEPPPWVDDAILAQARRALRTRQRARRWWVPLSVAATVLLAVSVVIEIDRETRPGPARPAAAPSTEAADAPQATSAQAAGEPPARHGESASSRAQPRPAIAAPPLQPAEPEPAAETGAREAIADDDSLRPKASSAFEAGTGRGVVPAAVSAAREMADAALPSPEDWLARIETLEAEGRQDEARRERERLEQAYPGWLERRSAGQQ